LAASRAGRSTHNTQRLMPSRRTFEGPQRTARAISPPSSCNDCSRVSSAPYRDCDSHWLDPDIARWHADCRTDLRLRFRLGMRPQRLERGKGGAGGAESQKTFHCGARRALRSRSRRGRDQLRHPPKQAGSPAGSKPRRRDHASSTARARRARRRRRGASRRD